MAHAWSCPQEAHTHRKGKRKAEWERWREGIITELPANTDKLSAVSLKKLSSQYTSIHASQSVSCFCNVRRQKYKHVFVSACVLPPSPGPIPTWCCHVSTKSSMSCHASETFSDELWVIANRPLWQNLHRFSTLISNSILLRLRQRPNFSQHRFFSFV